MSKFLQSVKLDPLEFEGDTLTATLKPIKRGLFVQLLPALQDIAAAKEEMEAGNAELSNDEMGKDPRILQAMGRVVAIAAPDLKDYVSDFTCPKDAAGAVIPLETVLDSAYFLQVQLWLVMGLVATANVKEDEAGKAARPSGA